MSDCVLDSTASSFVCLNCSGKMTVKLPLEVDEIVLLSAEFQKEHNDCVKPVPFGIGLWCVGIDKDKLPRLKHFVIEEILYRKINIWNVGTDKPVHEVVHEHFTKEVALKHDNKLLSLKDLYFVFDKPIDLCAPGAQRFEEYRRCHKPMSMIWVPHEKDKDGSKGKHLNLPLPESFSYREKHTLDLGNKLSENPERGQWYREREVAIKRFKRLADKYVTKAEKAVEDAAKIINSVNSVLIENDLEPYKIHL